MYHGDKTFRDREALILRSESLHCVDKFSDLDDVISAQGKVISWLYNKSEEWMEEVQEVVINILPNNEGTFGNKR